MKDFKITEPSCGAHSTFAVSGKTPHARYHVWCSVATGEPTDGVVFKNPPRNTRTGSPDDFRTRRLSSTRGEGAKVFAALMPHAEAVRQRVIELAAIEERVAEERAAQRRKDWAVREAAHDMLAALRKIDANAAESAEWIRIVARAAITKAEGRS